ncbi:MAG: ribosome maturation factor RimP [Ruminococcaceae bacterium]|nr:ribosome maturation factor RimP [Oscillospiraceae bacterium]
MAKKNVCTIVEEIATPIVAQNGCEIADVEFVREGSDYFLRVYIERLDRDERVDLNDCENISRALSDELDALDPIEQAYMLEVSSPGLDRPLKKDKDFERFAGSKVDVKLYRPVNGLKLICAVLEKLENGVIYLKTEDGNTIQIEQKDTAYVRLTVEF